MIEYLLWTHTVCVKIYTGFVNKFLSWGAFIPLGKLSFIVYIVHYKILFWMWYQVTHEVVVGHLYVVASTIVHAEAKLMKLF